MIKAGLGTKHREYYFLGQDMYTYFSASVFSDDIYSEICLWDEFGHKTLTEVRVPITDSNKLRKEVINLAKSYNIDTRYINEDWETEYTFLLHNCNRLCCTLNVKASYDFRYPNRTYLELSIGYTSYGEGWVDISFFDEDSLDSYVSNVCEKMFQSGVIKIC